MSQQNSGSEKVTLEDVVFRYMLDLSQTASRVRTSTDLEYQKNADNYYYQVMTLWGILGDYIDAKTEAKRIKLLVRAKAKYLKITATPKDKISVVKGRRDEVVSLTFNVASQTLRLMSICLSKKGILRERTGSAVAGTRKVEENEDMDAELNAETDIVDPSLVAGSNG